MVSLEVLPHHEAASWRLPLGLRGSQAPVKSCTEVTFNAEKHIPFSCAAQWLFLTVLTQAGRQRGESLANSGCLPSLYSQVMWGPVKKGLSSMVTPGAISFQYFFHLPLHQELWAFFHCPWRHKRQWAQMLGLCCWATRHQPGHIDASTSLTGLQTRLSSILHRIVL